MKANQVKVGRRVTCRIPREFPGGLVRHVVVTARVTAVEELDGRIRFTLHGGIASPLFRPDEDIA